jgi:uncharacterized protein
MAGALGPGTAVGLSYSSFAERFVAQRPGCVDYVEIPFEQLVHTPVAVALGGDVPLLLHCASLSLAGNAPPSARLVDQLTTFIETTRTPWVGEHLAYVRADGVLRQYAEHPALVADDLDPSEPFNVGYTVSPQLSEPILDRVLERTLAWRQRFGVPVLLENGPIYFEIPGSTMSQFEFIRRLCARSADVLLLLDLSHLAITCANLELDPHAALDGLPLDRVVEVHLSGVSRQSDVTWDDHGDAAPPLVFSLLDQLLSSAKPRAVTLEYNWDQDFPADVLVGDCARVRDMVHAHSQ